MTAAGTKRRNLTTAPIMRHTTSVPDTDSVGYPPVGYPLPVSRSLACSRPHSLGMGEYVRPPMVIGFGPCAPGIASPTTAEGTTGHPFW